MQQKAANYSCWWLWKYSASTLVFIPIIMLVCQSLQMSSVCTHMVLLCNTGWIYYTEKWVFVKEGRRDEKRWTEEFLPDPAPACDCCCCCWAARLDVTWGGCNGGGGREANAEKVRGAVTGIRRKKRGKWMWEEESAKGEGGHGMRIIRMSIKIKQPFQNLWTQQVQNIKELVMKSTEGWF